MSPRDDALVNVAIRRIVEAEAAEVEAAEALDLAIKRIAILAYAEGCADGAASGEATAAVAVVRLVVERIVRGVLKRMRREGGA